MKKKLLFGVWLLIPIVVLAFHYGPGQTRLAAERVAEKIRAAKLAEAAEDWRTAVAAYADAISMLPPDYQTPRHQLQLAHARARMFTGELPEAIVEMEGLLDDLLKDKAAPGEVREVRATLASAEYYAGWLMRLEGATAEEWMAETEQARQHFRLLAEETAGDKAVSEAHQKNLEATIRLERMDLSELQGLPLPKQCQGCKNCSQKCRAQRESKCKSPSEGKKDARGAGVGKRPPGGS